MNMFNNTIWGFGRPSAGFEGLGAALPLVQSACGLVQTRLRRWFKGSKAATGCRTPEPSAESTFLTTLTIANLLFFCAA